MPTKKTTTKRVLTENELIEQKAEEKALEMLNALLSNTDLTSIVSLDNRKGIIFIGGNKADKNELLTLKNEAEYLQQTRLWKLLQETPKELAMRAMFISSESLDDMKKGKTILYTLSTQKNIVDLLANCNPQ